MGNYNLIDLLEGFTYQIEKGIKEKKISELVWDTRNLCEGCLFICVKGEHFDGHSAVKEAIEKKAAAIIHSDPLDSSFDTSDCTWIRTDDTRNALAFSSAAYYGHPANELKVIGVTGTKGKTTTTYLVKNILEEAGFKTGLIGTIEIIIGEKKIPASHTTPEAYLIQKYFREMLDAGCSVCVMEVSSQGLKLNRTQGFQFEIGVFTNLEPDHIAPGEHESFEEYLECKSRLFKQCRHGIVNCDDVHCNEIIKDHTCTIETFGFDQNADTAANDMDLVRGPGYLGVHFSVLKKLVDQKRKKMDVELLMPGRFSVYNALAAIAICYYFKVDSATTLQALRNARVRGRIELVPFSDEYTVIIDYAHNAMSLKSLLTTLREYEPNRIVSIFGCGGNRSKSRRFEMGEVSGNLSEFTVITSDNPRFEEPLDIIKDIRTGIEKTKGKFVEIEDRKEAIAYALKNAQKGDILVIAGKGHEDYQEIKGIKYPMDDRKMIQEIREQK